MKRMWWLAAAVLLPRLLVFPFNENLGGDAIARTWLAHRWLESPHLITSFDGGGFQFGSLHIYLLALAEFLWPSLLHAGRVVSLIVGVGTAWPLFVFTHRRFGERAATIAVLLFATWGVHIQCSTTSASEALNLLLVMGAIAAFDAADRRWVWLAAVLLNLSCATRYDSWLLVPLLAAALWWRDRSFIRALLFGAASSVFAVGWMFGNFHDKGDPLFIFKFIDAFHRDWWPAEAAHWGALRYRVMCFFFWPGTAVFTLTPLIAAGGFIATWRAWKERPELRWYVVVLALPWLLYGVRGAFFSSFAPLARFTLKEVLLLIPLAAWWLSERDLPLRRWGIAMSAVWCLFLAVFCFNPDGRFSAALRAVAPTSRIDASMRVTTDAIGERWKEGLVVFDEDPREYDDLIVSYFSRVPFDEQLRRRYRRYDETLGERVPQWLVLFDGGRMVRDGEVRPVDASHVRFADQSYVLRDRARISVYEREH